MNDEIGEGVPDFGSPAPEPLTGRRAALRRFREPAPSVRVRARSTETDGWQALWRIEGQTIRVIALNRTSGASRMVPFAFEHHPDPVEMRERAARNGATLGCDPARVLAAVRSLLTERHPSRPAVGRHAP